MKKVILGTIFLSFELMGMQPGERRLQVRNGIGAITRMNEDVAIVRREDRPTELVEEIALPARINFRQIRNPVSVGESVQISIRDFVYSQDGGNKQPVSAWYTKSYPLQKSLLRYGHDLAAGFSHPIQELFAMVTDVEYADRRGKIVVESEYHDVGGRVQHQRRDTGQYAMDDDNLRAQPFTEIFVVTELGEEILDAAKLREGTRFVAYTRTDTPARVAIVGVPEARANDSEFNYQRTETAEEWIRPDKTIFTKRTEGVKKVAKPTPPPPLPAPIQYKDVPVYKRVWKGGWLNRHSEWKQSETEHVPITRSY